MVIVSVPHIRYRIGFRIYSSYDASIKIASMVYIYIDKTFKGESPRGPTGNQEPEPNSTPN